MCGLFESFNDLQIAIIKTIDGRNGISKTESDSLKTFFNRYTFFLELSNEISFLAAEQRGIPTE